MHLLDYQGEPGEAEQDERYFCEKCGRYCKSGSGLASHLRVCGRRPTDEELIAMREMSLSYRAISERLDVSETTVGKWLKEIDAKNGKEKPIREPFILHHHLAPAKGEWRMRCVDNWGDPLCPVIEECVLFMEIGLWALCEAPAESDLIKADQLGIMYELFIETIRGKIDKWYREGRRGSTSKQKGQAASEGGEEGEVGPQLRTPVA